MTDFGALLRSLSMSGVEFIVVGGATAAAHGSAIVTYDLDIVYQRSHQNIDRLVGALAPFEPDLRGAPPGLPFRWSSETIRQGLNFTLKTSVGDIDLLGEIAGGGQYEDLVKVSERIEAFGISCWCLSVSALITAKRAAGRPKDFQAIAELEAMLEDEDPPDNNSLSGS